MFRPAFLLALVCLLAPAPPAPAGALPTPRLLFAEPLTPVMGRPGARETAALDRAIAAYQATGNSEAVEPLLTFLASYPTSPWKPALLANLGVLYRHAGYFSRALAAWEEAWSLLWPIQAQPLLSLGNLVAGELLDLHGRIGNRERMRQLLRELEGRPLRGAAAEQVSRARRGLWIMEHDPEQSYRCGPLALAAIHAVQGQHAPGARLQEALSTYAGTSLWQNLRWAQECGMGLQAAHRQPGAPMPVPALVHWKVGHFAALVDQRDGQYLVRDPTFGEEHWLSAAALDAEASGYALVPVGPLAAGWRPVAAAEAQTVRGKGTTDTDPDYDDPDPRPDCRRPGMPVHGFYLAYLALSLADTPVGYAPPRGYPVAFRVSYNQRNRNQPTTFTFANLGPGWSFQWSSYLQDDPGNPRQTVQLYDGSGERRPYTGYDASTQSFAIQFRTLDQLVHTSATSYELRQADGSKEVYGQPDGKTTYPRRVFLTQRVDASGNALTFGYDARMRLTTVVDALGQTTTLSYDLGSDPLKITRVTDPFGRTAVLTFSPGGQLASITDAVGLTSSFSYGPTPGSPSAPADFLNALTTPYGITTFQMGEAGLWKWLEVTDPAGQKERLEFRHDAPGIAMSEPKAPAGFLNDHLRRRNTYFWDKHAMAQCPGDYGKARITHFLHAARGTSVLSSLVESTKAPLESRIWRGYGNPNSSITEGASAQPMVEARLLDDGTEQRTTWQYNRWGKVTRRVDPVGRTTDYHYSPDGLDLLEVRNRTGGRNDLLAACRYDSRHRMIGATDSAGRTTTFTYNAHGQVLTITNPKGQTTTFSYDTQGYLKQVAGAEAEARVSFGYDRVGRLDAVTGPEAGPVYYRYDHLDRRTQVVYADATAETTVYDRLHVGRVQDRKGQWTLMTSNANRQLVETQDPLGRVTGLGWCGCGSLETLKDPLGRVTSWIRDLQGRVISKLYPDRTSTRYDYDGSGRLIERIDAKGQSTRYAYGADDALKQVSYANADPPTPTVSYHYDPAYPRLSAINDGTGTTTFSYHPIGPAPGLGAGRLAVVTPPLARSSISYGYDELGRVITRDINGSTETRTFDSLGRLTGVAHALGSFGYDFIPGTHQLGKATYPNGQVSTYSYFDATGDHRLRQIRHLKADGGNLSSFGYTYEAGGQVRTWSQAADVAAPRVASFTYDPVGQLLGSVLADTGTNQVLKTYLFGYDGAGNRTTEQFNGGITTSSHNILNQLIDQALSATPLLRGDSPATPPRP